MAVGNAEQSTRRRRADLYPASRPSGRRGAGPAYQPYERPLSEQRRSAQQRNEADYYPAAQLKTLTPAEMRAIALVIVVVTLVAMGIIFLSAQATVTQKEINDLKKGITQVDDDIANLKIEIEQSQNMQLIKNRAIEELNMKEASFDQYVFVSELPDPQSDFARYIKERAYGGAEIQAIESDQVPESE